MVRAARRDAMILYAAHAHASAAELLRDCCAAIRRRNVACRRAGAWRDIATPVRALPPPFTPRRQRDAADAKQPRAPLIAAAARAPRYAHFVCRRAATRLKLADAATIASLIFWLSFSITPLFQMPPLLFSPPLRRHTLRQLRHEALRRRRCRMSCTADIFAFTAIAA